MSDDKKKSARDSAWLLLLTFVWLCALSTQASDLARELNWETHSADKQSFYKKPNRSKPINWDPLWISLSVWFIR